MFQFTRPGGRDLSKRMTNWGRLGFNSRARVGATYRVNVYACLVGFQFTRPGGRDTSSNAHAFDAPQFQFTRPGGRD